MRKKKSLITKCSAAVMSLLMVAGSVGNYSIVYAANAFKAGDSFKIKYTHNNKIFTKKAVDARWNGKVLGTKMPGYIDEDDNAMYSAYWIFGQSKGPKVLYKNSGDTFTLSRYSTTVKMTVNSKYAYVNGKKVTMATPARKVYNYKNDTNYIMVPGAWTAKQLGIHYKWDGTKRAGCMSAATQSGNSGSTTTTASKPATTTASKPTTTTTTETRPTTPTKPEVTKKNVTTSYDMTASDYAKEQSKAVPKYDHQTYDQAAYQKKIMSEVNEEQYLQIDTYHNVNESLYAQKMEEMLKNKANSVLKGKANVIITAAKKEKIDPVYLLSQTLNESAYGTSDLSKKTITEVITGDSLKKDANGNVIGFLKVNGKYITKKISSTTVYNLYGIKAYDSDPQLCGSSYAYYMGWTSVNNAINGAAKYVADNYIHNASYQQNTLYKMRYNQKKDNLWHQYSTNPSYAEEIGNKIHEMKEVYDGCSNAFVYDRPSFAKEPETTTTTVTKPTTTTAKPTTTTTTATKQPTTVKYTVTGALPNSRVKASKSNYDLRIKLPEKVTKYYLEDKYTSRQLFMSCAGNYVSHFKKSANRSAKSTMSDFTVKYNSDKERTYVYIKPSSSYRGYSVTFNNGYAYVKWGTPKTMYKNIVVIDAGHGGTDSGAVGNGLREKDLTLSIVLGAKKYFDENKNYAVYYTRTTDTYPSLTARSQLANDVGADYFLSCHINSASATAKGSETLYNSQGYKATNGVTSYKWAANVHNFTKAATGFTNRGLVNRTGLAVLRHTRTASTLTEFGFITNKAEATSMKANTGKYGKAMYNSVVKMFQTNPSKR